MQRWGECATVWTCVFSIGGSGRKEVQAGSYTRHIQHPREQRRGGSQPPPRPPAPLPVFPTQQIRQSAVVEFHVKAALTLPYSFFLSFCARDTVRIYLIVINCSFFCFRYFCFDLLCGLPRHSGPKTMESLPREVFSFVLNIDDIFDRFDDEYHWWSKDDKYICNKYFKNKNNIDAEVMDDNICIRLIACPNPAL